MITQKTNLNNWWETAWYKEWEEFAQRSYHGKHPGHWVGLVNSRTKKVEYVFIPQQSNAPPEGGA